MVVASKPSREVGKPGLRPNAGLLDKVVHVMMFVPQVLLFVPFQALEFVTGSSAKQLLARLAFSNSEQPAKQTNRQTNYVQVSEFLQLYPAAEEETVVNGVEGRRLTVLFSWLMAKPQHLNKYIKIFTNYNIDVLKVQVSPLDVLRPAVRSQIAAKEVCEYLLNNPQYKRVFVYGFSVGAYQFCESIKMIRENPERYGSIPDRFVGHMWDSVVDVPSASEGISKSIVQDSRLQKWIESYLEWFLKIRYDSATRHHLASSAHMHKGPMDKPALYVYSHTDTISDSDNNAKIIKGWRESGMSVSSKAFDEGGHVALYSRHQEEYTKLLNDLLVQIGFVERAKIKKKFT